MAASSVQRGRSSSLFSSSSPHSLSSDWLVFSPTSQSHSHSHSQPPPPIRQRTFRRMSPTRASAGAAKPEPASQKRTSSLTSFFNKILPSNRPEPGGTHHTTNLSADNGDVVVNPDELTGWNIAKEKNPAYPISTSTAIPDETNHRRVWSWSPQKGDSRFVENLPRDRSRGREQIPDAANHEALPRKSEALTRTEVRDLLKSKEETRKNRRSLKESGDWLGVQGADPYSGQYTVLTPTDTPSSETTTPSTRSKLAGLARKKKAAKLEYEQIRLVEEQEKDKAKLDKEQAKLNKIERVKEELRRQHQFAKWTQHKRHWSSAAEPNLSPIAQSIDSVALGSSETSSLLFSELPTDTIPSDIEETPTTIPNFSRPTRPPVSMHRLSSDNNTQLREQRRFDQSSETIIHNSPDATTEHVSPTRPTSQPSGAHLNAAQPDVGRTKSEKHFLWRRRRGTDPGKSGSNPARGFIMSMRAQNVTSNSIEHIHKDHFADLAIPDYHLHLLTPETVEAVEPQSTSSDDSPLMTPNPNHHLRTTGENKLAMSSMTSLVHPKENGRIDSQDTNAATATSSQSKLKGIMRGPSIRRKLVPNLSSPTQTKETERHQASPPNFDELQDHTINGFSGDTPECKSPPPTSNPQGRISIERAGTILSHTNNHIGRARRGSVSIPTTTIIGCGPDQQNRLASLEPKLEVQSNPPKPELKIRPKQIDGQIDGVVEIEEILAAPTSIDRHERYTESIPVPEERRTPSPPTTPRSGSPNPTLVQETPETGIISDPDVTLEKKPPTRVSTPTTPRLCRIIQQNAETNRKEMSKEIDTAKKAESTGTATPKPTEVKPTEVNPMEVKGTGMQETEDPKVGRSCHDVTLARNRAASVQRPHPHLTSEELKETMPKETMPKEPVLKEIAPKDIIVEEAARIAVLRSRAKEIVRNKSADRKANKNSDRTPSPSKRKISNSKLVESKHSLQQKRPRKRRPSEGGAGTGIPSRPNEHITRSKTRAQLKSIPEDAERPEETFKVVKACKTVYIVFLGLACTWWITVQPAFDQQSDLWRRKHRKESTWRDVGVFASAGVFCLAAGLGVWYVMGVLWWIVQK
ncbi:hypothetical protein F4819DRAFT_295861 [Hypoxylon fuscum]|nr:hypothetical protein F4819DRAFT_295861 [Hypoxylon fuscum]